MDRTEDHKIDDQKLNDNRSAPDHSQIDFAEQIQKTQFAGFIMCGADYRNGETEKNAEQDSGKCDFKRDQKTIAEIFPAVVLDEVDVKRVAEISP